MINEPHGPFGTPSSLTPDGFAYFAARLADYDDLPIKLLFTVNKRLARIAVKHHGEFNTNHACRVGFFLAVRRFDPSAGNTFATYARHWVEKEVRDLALGLIRVDWRGQSLRQFSINRSMDRINGRGRVKSEGVWIGLADDKTVTDCPNVHQEDGERLVRKWMTARLKPRAAAIAYDYIVNEKRLADIGAEYKISKQRVLQIVNDAKKKLRLRAKKYQDSLVR